MNIEKIGLSKKLDTHNQDHVVLFRHFVIYVLRIALLQHEQLSFEGKNLSFRKCLEEILASLKNIGNPVSNMPSIKT